MSKILSSYHGWYYISEFCCLQPLETVFRKIYRNVKNRIEWAPHKQPPFAQTDKEVKHGAGRGKEARGLGDHRPQTAGHSVWSHGKPEKIKNACVLQAFFSGAIDSRASMAYTENNT